MKHILRFKELNEEVGYEQIDIDDYYELPTHIQHS